MADIKLAEASRKQVWTEKRYSEYVRKSGFRPFMGPGQNNIIHVRNELKSKRGDTMHIPLFAKLKGEPKRGAQPIEGNEKGIANFDFPISLDFVGEGVAVSNYEQFRTEIELLDVGKESLTAYMGEIMRNDIIDAFNSKDGINDITGLSGYIPASSAIRNAWKAGNDDRVLFGAALGNSGGPSTSFDVALANIDKNDDKLSKKVIEVARYVARNAKRIVGPSVVKERAGMSGKGGNYVECYVMFVGARSFFWLKQDPVLKEELKMALERGVTNPLFQPDDYLLDNVVIREIPEITERCLLAGAGASNVDVEPFYLCGAQAIGYAAGSDPIFSTDARDYGFINGVAVRELRGIKKTVFTGPMDDSVSRVDHGLVTGYVAAPQAE